MTEQDNNGVLLMFTGQFTDEMRPIYIMVKPYESPHATLKPNQTSSALSNSSNITPANNPQ